MLGRPVQFPEDNLKTLDSHPAGMSRGCILWFRSSMRLADGRAFFVVDWIKSLGELVDPALHEVPGTEDVSTNSEVTNHLPAAS